MTDSKYSKIRDASPPVSKRRRMSRSDRAAQFAPFAALTGFGARINEASRLTNAKIELDEQSRERLDKKLLFLSGNLGGRPLIEVCFFVPDKRKSGGSCQKYVGRLRRIDFVLQKLIFEDKTRLDFHDIVFINGEIFVAMKDPI